MSLIPDKTNHENGNGHYNIRSMSDWCNYSGIAIYTDFQSGLPISVARYYKGAIIRQVYMVATNKDEYI